MSSRLEKAFADAASQKKKILVAYLCVGDPSVDESIALAKACLDAGADVLELGVPFSDPTADGPVIARASERALKNGSGLTATLRVAKAIRASHAAPLVLFGYYNPLFIHGEERSVDDAVEHGVDAFLIVDLPLGEGEKLRNRAAERGVSVVPLLAPTSSTSRVEDLRALGASTNGHRPAFVYYVSVTGVTGAHAIPLDEASARAAELRGRHGIPTVLGFGIDGPEKARAAAGHVEGVVVGTALVRAIESGSSPADRLARVEGLVKTIRTALDQPAP